MPPQPATTPSPVALHAARCSAASQPRIIRFATTLLVRALTFLTCGFRICQIASDLSCAGNRKVMVSGRIFIKMVTSMDAAAATAIFVFFSIHEVTAYSENTIPKAQWFDAVDLGSTGFVRMPIPGSSSAITPDSPEPADEPSASAVESTGDPAPAADDQPGATNEVTPSVDPKVAAAADEVASADAVAPAASEEQNVVLVVTADDATGSPARSPATGADGSQPGFAMTSVVVEGSAVGAGASSSATVIDATSRAGRVVKANGKPAEARRQLKRNRPAAAASASA